MKDTYPCFKMELFFLGYVFFEFLDVVTIPLFLGDSLHGLLDPVHFLQTKFKDFLGGHAGGEVEVQTWLVEGFPIGKGGVGNILSCVREILLQTSKSHWTTYCKLYTQDKDLLEFLFFWGVGRKNRDFFFLLNHFN